MSTQPPKETSLLEYVIAYLQEEQRRLTARTTADQHDPEVVSAWCDAAIAAYEGGAR